MSDAELLPPGLYEQLITTSLEIVITKLGDLAMASPVADAETPTKLADHWPGLPSAFWPDIAIQGIRKLKPTWSTDSSRFWARTTALTVKMSRNLLDSSKPFSTVVRPA